MRGLGEKGRVASGAAAAVAVATSCINFAPAVGSQASAVEAARSVDVVFADVTAAGSDDVIVLVSQPGDDALVRMSPCGEGCLERREQVTIAAEGRQLDADDFDGDGATDIVVVTSVDVRVYFGGGATAGRPEGLAADDFVVAAQPQFGAWHGVVAGDFDDDGDADIALTSRLTYEFVAGDGDRGFVPRADPVAIGPSSAAYGPPAAGDVDGDGDLEVLVTTTDVLESSASVSTYRDGVSPLGGHAETNGALFFGLTSGDIDGDGLDDVAIVRHGPPIDSRDVLLLRSTGTGFTGFGPGGAVTSVPDIAAVDLELRDIDLDGNTDIIASDGSRLSWWHGVRNGNFVVRVDRAAGPGPSRLAFGAVGGNARADLVVANATAPFAEVSYLPNASQL